MSIEQNSFTDPFSPSVMYLVSTWKHGDNLRYVVVRDDGYHDPEILFDFSTEERAKEKLWSIYRDLTRQL